MSTVAIIDDHRVFSDWLAAFVDAQPGWSVVGVAEDAVAGLALVRSVRPAVVLVDIGLPGRNGLWLTERAIATIPHLRVVLMSDAEPEEYAEAAALAGAFAYLPKHAISRDLPALLRGATGGGPGAGGGRPANAVGPGRGQVGGRRSSGPDRPAGATLLERSGLPWSDLVPAGLAFLGFAAAAEPTLGVAAAVALLSLHRQWSPPRVRRGRAEERGLQRSNPDR